jgi:hypothetical protein
LRSCGVTQTGLPADLLAQGFDAETLIAEAAETLLVAWPPSNLRFKTSLVRITRPSRPLTHMKAAERRRYAKQAYDAFVEAERCQRA